MSKKELVQSWCKTCEKYAPNVFSGTPCGNCGNKYEPIILVPKKPTTSKGKPDRKPRWTTGSKP